MFQGSRFEGKSPRRGALANPCNELLGIAPEQDLQTLARFFQFEPSGLLAWDG
jgi:hypothetical protein